jgi:hypothetical protein
MAATQNRNSKVIFDRCCRIYNIISIVHSVSLQKKLPESRLISNETIK